MRIRKTFTTLCDFEESVGVFAQIVIEKQYHGELGKHETHLQRKRERDRKNCENSINNC